MKYRLVLGLALWLSWTTASSQDALSLSQCFQMMESNHPLARQSGLQAALSETRQDQLNRNYWPRLEVQGQATWQNEVTRVDIPISIPGFETPTAPQDQYRILGEVTQTIYDGGATRHLKAAAKAEQGAVKLQTDADLYRLRFQVHQLYFGILMMREQSKMLDVVQNELQRKEKQLADLYAGGIVQRKDLDLLAVELIRHRQSLEHNQLQEATMLANLSELTGANVTAETILSLPERFEAGQESRVEWALFAAKEDILLSQKNLIQVQRLPKLSAFAQGGLGQPGFNVFDPDPAPLFIAGARLRWNLGAWYMDQPDREMIRLNQEVVRQQEAGFKQSLSLQVRQAENQAETFQRFLITDQEILDRRTRIKETAAIQLAEGIITTPDYLREIDAWYQANLQYELHRIQAVQYTIESQLIAGKSKKQ